MRASMKVLGWAVGMLVAGHAFAANVGAASTKPLSMPVGTSSEARSAVNVAIYEDPDGNAPGDHTASMMIDGKMVRLTPSYMCIHTDECLP